MTKMEIKGITLKSRLDFIEHTYGSGALVKLIPQMKGEVVKLISDKRRIRATSWYDFDVQIQLDRAICRILADGDDTIYRKMGEFSADFQKDYSTVSDQTDPWKFLQMQQVIFGRFFRPGKMVLIRVSATEGIMRLQEFRSKRENCETNLGFLQRSIENHGKKNVKVIETHCSEDPRIVACEYHFEWEN